MAPRYYRRPQRYNRRQSLITEFYNDYTTTKSNDGQRGSARLGR